MSLSSLAAQLGLSIPLLGNAERVDFTDRELKLLMLSGINATSGGSQKKTAALAASLQVVATAGTLVSLLGTNTGGAQHIQIWDAADSSDADAELLFTFPIGAATPFSVNTPIIFTRGLLVRNASQAVSANPTANAGSADCWFTARHV